MAAVLAAAGRYSPTPRSSPERVVSTDQRVTLAREYLTGAQ
jgi:hypothetical protein